MGELGPNTVPQIGWDTQKGKAKSSTPHLAPNEVFRIIFIEAFQATDLIFAINLSIWACTLMKKQKSND